MTDDSEPNLKLLVAIPVYNERRYVRDVLSRVRDFCQDILVVDDASSDGTAQLLAELGDAIHLLRHPTNMGYGRSLIDAFGFATEHGYDWVITMDCDEQHEPERIPDFIEQIKTNQWDIISGSRYLQPGCHDDLPPDDRRSINLAVTSILNDLLKMNLTDAFCGFKAHRVAAMKPLALDEAGYAFPLQLWPRAMMAGLRISEIPVRLIYNDPTRHFGGALDDADQRLKHYLQVLCREIEHPHEAC